MKSQLPNIVTGCNLICGCIATHFAFLGKLEYALLFIIIGAVFDFCDGLVARALGISSPIGKELDSLADVITFGFAPSAIIYYELCVLDYPARLSMVSEYLPFMAFILAAFSALRLAKFNLDTRQTTSFIGLPTPANALFWASVIVGGHQWFENTPYGFAILLFMMLTSCYLLICEMPMFALKFKHWGINEPGNIIKYGFITFSLAAIIVSVIMADSIILGIENVIAVIILAYILVSFIVWSTKSSK